MKRILFVDDESQVLGALRALLRSQRSRWEMTFVESGEAALAELAESPYDVLVADMRMPGMDGATLLQHVHERHPQVVRIVLSGYAEMEMAIRAVPVAHQFLAKPCDRGVLLNAVERACDLQALIQSDAVRRIAGSVQSLPPMPKVYFELTRVLADENSGVTDVARVIERDPTMVAKVLQLVNSAFIGLGRPIASVEQAVAYLGTRLLKDLTLVAHVFGGQGFDAAAGAIDAIQIHSLRVGAIARRLAGDDARLAEDAFIAGVLHDIGKLILAAERPSLFTSFIARARDSQRPMFEIEREELGTTHAELGGYLLGLWGLPYPLIEAVANHHSPHRVCIGAATFDAFAAVYVANVLAHEIDSSSDTGPFVELDPAIVNALSLSDRLPEWRKLAAEVAAEQDRNARRAA